VQRARTAQRGFERLLLGRRTSARRGPSGGLGADAGGAERLAGAGKRLVAAQKLERRWRQEVCR
jgi:hypothetical protein